MNDKSSAGSAAPPRRPSVNLPLGRLLSTPGAIEAMGKAGQEPLELLNRHRIGD